MEVENTANIETEYLMVTVIGDSGVGKSLLAATAHKDQRKLFIVAADPKGIVTLTTNGMAVNYRKVSAANPYNDTMKILTELAALNPFPYEAVIFDDASTLQLKIKNWIAKTKREEILSKAGKEDPRKLYGFLKHRFQDILVKASDLPAHLIYLAWAKEGDAEKGIPGHAMLEGQSGTWLEGTSDAVLLLRATKTATSKIVNGKEVKVMVPGRELRTRPFDDFALKNRLGLPDPFTLDISVTNDGQPPKWTKGLDSLLNWKAAKPRAQPARVAQLRAK